MRGANGINAVRSNVVTESRRNADDLLTTSRVLVSSLQCQ